MSYKTYFSPNGWFSLTLPIDWEEYEDDDTDESTCAFFNAKKWTGNFRLTPFRWTNLMDPSEDKATKYINEELNENEGATIMKLGELDCVHYKKDLLQDGDNLVIYYWVAGKKDNLFVCSFTIDKLQEQTEENKGQLSIVHNIIKSIKII